MATYQTDDGPVERPLIFNDPSLAAEMAALRDKIVEDQGCGDEFELVGVKAAPDGRWFGVFRPKANI